MSRSEVLLRLVDSTGSRDVSVESLRVGFEDVATVGDLLGGLGVSGGRVGLSHFGRLLGRDLRLSDVGLRHGDSVELVAAGDAGGVVGVGYVGSLCLVQVSGSERGRRIFVRDGGSRRVSVVRFGDEYVVSDEVASDPLSDGDSVGDDESTYEVAGGGGVPSDGEVLGGDLLGWFDVGVGDGGGLLVSPGFAAEIDGDGSGVVREVLAGSSVLIRLPAIAAGGSSGGVEFRVVEEGSKDRVEGGWVDYRVRSEGTSADLEFDSTKVNIASAPRAPSQQSIVERLLSYVPMLFMSGFLALTTGRWWFLAIYAAGYGIRFIYQDRKQAKQLQEHEANLQAWRDDFEDAKAYYAEFVIEEVVRKFSLLGTALDKKNRWLLFNRMSGFWGREPGDQGFLSVLVGFGVHRSEQVLELPSGFDGWDEKVERRHLDDLRVCSPAPVAVDLESDHLAVIGSVDACMPVASYLVADLVANHSPLHVSVALMLPSEGDLFGGMCEWGKWLPHVRQPTSCLSADRVVRGGEATEQWLLQLRRRLVEGVELRTWLVLLIQEGVEPDIGLLGECVELAAGRIRVVWIASNEQSVPKLVDDRLFVKSGSVEGKLLGDLDSYRSALEDKSQRESLRRAVAEEEVEAEVDLVAEEFAHELTVRSLSDESELGRLARAFAPLTDERQGAKSASIPSHVLLDSFLGLPGFTDIEEVASVRIGDSSKSLELFLGIRSDSADGLLTVDLVRDGPHMLVGGTTGSGKSEFLQSVVASAVTRYSEIDLNVALVDFKGGASFDVFRDLPHVVAEASNLDPAHLERVVTFLSGELDFRMRVLSSQGDRMGGSTIKDYETFRSVGGSMPRLLVVLDEFAAAVNSNPEVKQLADSIAARGRSLGVHVIFATQNPQNSTTGDMETNIGARVCLRMLSDGDAKSVVGDVAPAAIPVDLPGRAYLRASDGSLTEFQSPWATGPVSERSQPVLVERF